MTLKYIRAIDKGGFGNVDVVRNDDGVMLARKTFSRNQPLDDTMLANVMKRFRKEARIQSGINHSNIVPIIGGDLDCDPPYYLMPLAAGSLSDDIQRDRTLGGKFVAAISDIVSGLDELHSMQIYHRDLKPKNVLRYSTAVPGDPDYYAIGDFGLIAMKESRLSLLTKTGMAKGSDYYTAPEITQDLRAGSVQSDIYSLGCILHEMVGTESRIPCAEIREKGDFSQILLGCTRKDPRQRFKSVRAVLDAVLSVSYAGQQPIPTRKSQDFVSALTNPAPPPPPFWQELADFLQNESAPTERNPILGALTDDRLREAFAVAAGPANLIALEVARWISTTSFNFDSCDGLANRLETIVELGDFESGVDCLMAMLELGTSHNRWYVERKFCRLCDPTMDANLAKRLAIQFRIGGDDVCRSIQHLEHSISVSRANLHPVLVSALSEICK